jgi:predicted ATPase
MRLDKLTIGSSKDSPTHQFKNLKDVTIDFDQDHWLTVVIGWNGTGKSNVLEALAIIFRDLIGKKRTPEFAFQLDYRMGARENLRHIHIDADPDRKKEPFTIYVATDAQARGEGTLISIKEGEALVSALRGKVIKLTAFLNPENGYLPRYVFSYYSGESQRMHEVFRPYLENYDSKLRNGEDPGMKRLFYAMPVHSQFVLLAFMIKQSTEVRELLEKDMGIDPDEGIESVLFVLKQPSWSKRRGNKKIDIVGDERFWGAKGVVQTFLDRLQTMSLAPIKVKRDKQITLWNKEATEFQYLYVKDIDALRKLVGDQLPAQFFRDLESTYVSELIEEVRIRVRLKKNDGSVTFRELSEGEQQLLTVLGLLRFTAEDESLFLLDEPDTHLNPRWSVDYFNYLKSFVGQSSQGRDSSHIVLTTHNPLAIAELVKEQVQILKRNDETNQVQSQQPDFDPRGMGYAGIVTSDMFGLAAALDTHTQELLEKRRVLSLKDGPLSQEEQDELDRTNLELDGYGFRYATRDPLFEEYLRARFHFDETQSNSKKLAQLGTAERRDKARELLKLAAIKVKHEQEGATDASN